MPDQPDQSDDQAIDLPFPEKGIDESSALYRQDQATSPDMLNMLVIDSRTKRKRGGSRHGSTRHSAALDGSNAIQCLIQANASQGTVPAGNVPTNTTITPQPGPTTTNSVVASSTASGQAALSAPPSGGAPTTLTGPAANFQMNPAGDGTVILPGDGVDAGYVMITPVQNATTGVWTATKTAYRNTDPKATYLASAWTQTGRAVILTRAKDASGSSTLATAVYSSLSDSDTTIQVTNGAVFVTPAGVSLTNFVVQIDQEQIKIASVTGNSLSVTSRHYNDTQAASHNQGATVTLVGSTSLSAACYSGVTDSATTLNVSSAAPFYPAAPFTISVDNELMRVTAKSGTALTVTRESHGTTKTRHPTGAAVTLYGKTTLSTTLDSSLASGTTGSGALLVADGSGFPSSGAFCVTIDSETILCTGRTGNGLNITTRGYNSTTPAAHAAGSTIRSATAALSAALTSGINTSATTFTVGSTTPFPFASAGSYSIQVDGEVMTVGASGLNTTTKTFTVTRSGSPAAHSYGASVVPYASTALSADALSGITSAETSALKVASLAGFPTSGTFGIQINNERIRVGGRTAATNTLTTLTRGVDYVSGSGTVTSDPANHQTGTTVTMFAVSKLSSSMTSASTAFVMASDSASLGLFPSQRTTTNFFYVQIDSEIIKVTGGSTTTFSGLVRAQFGTTAAAHAANATVTLVQSPSTTVTSTGATSLTVTAPSVGTFPTSGQFNVLVGTERMTCTRASSTSLTIVARGVAGSNGVATTISSHLSGATVSLDTVAVGGAAATYSSTTLTTNNVTTFTVDNGALLPATGGYVIKVESEEMTVSSIATNTVTVTRPNPVDHPTVGTTVALKTPVTTTLTGSPSTSVVSASAATFPTTGPYTIRIENEEMSVASLSTNTFTVTRGVNGTQVVDHASGVDITLVGSTGTATVADTGDTTLTVTNAALLPFAPASGNATVSNYPIVVDAGTAQSEVMTVTAINTTTSVVTVTRTAALAKNHGQGATVAKNFNAASGVANAGGQSVTVASASSFPGSTLLPFTIQIDNEQMSVTAISSNTFTVTRGINNTAVSTHSQNAPVTQVGTASKQQVQYEVRDKTGTAITSATSLFTIAAGSSIYGMTVQDSSSSFVWIWVGALTGMSIADFTTPAPVSGNDKQMVLKLAMTSAGLLSATGGLVIGPKGGTATPKLVNGIGVSTANVARHGAMTILSGNGVTPRIVLAETGSYPTASSDYTTTHLQGYRCDTGVAIDSDQLVALPSGTFTGPCVTAPQQLIAMGQRSDKTQVLLSTFNQVAPSSSNSYDVIATYPFPNTLASPTAVTTAITSSSVASQTLSAQEVPIVDQRAEQYSSVAYNGDTNTALVVHRTAAGTTPHARVFSMSDGGAGATGNPLSNANLEWCAPAPWGWIAAGYTGSADVVGLSHDLTQLWSATVGYTAAANIRAGVSNYVRMIDYTTGISGRSPASFLYSKTAFSITERTYDSFTVTLGVAPDPGTTVSVTFTSDKPQTALLATSQTGTKATSVTLSWTAADYSTAKSVFVFGVLDATSESTDLVTVSSTVVTTDRRYAAVDPQDVLVNVDDSITSYLFGATAATLNEGGSTVQIPLRLGSTPSSSVTVSFSSSDTGKATVSPSSLTFAANSTASTDQFITITSGTVTSDSTVTITTTQSSSDTNYNSLNPSDLTITVLDVPVAYTFGATAGSVKEGSTLQIGLRLGRAPTSNVTVNFTSSDVSQATVTSSLTFTTANYATSQYLTVTGVADATSEGPVVVSITSSVTSSDADYAAVTPSTLAITVEDVRLPSAHVLTTLAIAGGKLFDVSIGTSPATISGGTFSTSRVVRAASLGYLVLFADGTNKLMYDASVGQLKAWVPSSGTFPSANGSTPRCVETWRDRVVQFGMDGDPQNYWATRRFTWDNWSYPAAGSISDVDAPFNGNLSKAGLFPGGVMTGLIPYNNDLAILGGDNGLYQWSGDPAAGAVFDEITSAAGTGMAFGRAWCKDPLGQVYFFGRTGGVYRLRLNTPAQIMTDRLTTLGVERMIGVDLDAYVPSLMWDNYLQGVHVFLTPYSLSATPYWYFFDAGTEGWFKCRFATDVMHPLAVTPLDGDSSNDRKLGFGTRDGRILYLNPSATTDDDTAYQSYVTIGPVSQFPGRVVVESLMAEQTGLSSWSVLYGDTAEAALASPGVSYGTVNSNIVSRRRVRGRVIYFKGSRSSGPWSMERINVGLTKVRN
jgi:hypothetical protein